MWIEACRQIGVAAAHGGVSVIRVTDRRTITRSLRAAAAAAGRLLILLAGGWHNYGVPCPWWKVTACGESDAAEELLRVVYM